MATVLLALASAGAAAVPARPGDGFEHPLVTPGTYVTRSAGDTFGRWTVTRGTIDQIGRGYWQAADSRQSIDLNGTSEGTVRTTFMTVPLVKYRVTYFLAGNPAGGPVVKTGRVSINGVVRETFAFDTTGRTFAAMGYVRRSFTFAGPGGKTTLDFASTSGAGAYGLVVDKVTALRCTTPGCA